MHSLDLSRPRRAANTGLFNGAQDQPFQQVTLKPDKYAYHVPLTRKYALKLDVVRALTHAWFAPVE